MSKINQRVELVANLCIIVVAALLAVVVAQKYVFNSSAAPGEPAESRPAVGGKINLPGVDWSRKPKTLVMVLQKGCHFCSESAPFYKRLSESVRDKGVQLVVVLPNVSEESAPYLDGLGLSGVEVKQMSLNELQVGGTPTLILLDGKGEVTRYWVGKLPSEKEKEVLEQLTS